nr:porin family protein [Thalassobius sp. Cn5-15]
MLFRARLAKVQGDHARALPLLQQAWHFAPTDLPVQRELAHSLFVTGQHQQAARHLRQLLQRDRNATLRASYRAMLQQISAADPLSFALRFSARPSTNINNGTSAGQFETVLGDFVVGEESRKTSGTGYSVAGQMRWQTPLSAWRGLRLSAVVVRTRYPSYQQLDKTDLDLSFGLRQLLSQRSWVEPRLILRGVNARDRSDYTARGLGIGLQHALAHGGHLSWDIAAEQRHYDHQTYRNGPAYQMRIGWQRQINALLTLTLTVRGNHIGHRADHLAHRDLTLGAELRRQISPALRGSLTLNHGIRRYRDIAPLSHKRRRERYTALSAAVQFDHLTVRFGTPEVRCTISQTDSNITLYSYNSQSCGLSLTTEF